MKRLPQSGFLTPETEMKMAWLADGLSEDQRRLATEVMQAIIDDIENGIIEYLQK